MSGDQCSSSVPRELLRSSYPLYLLVFQGGMAAGSVLWGAVAARAGLSVALEAAAAMLVVGLAISVTWRLRAAEGIDLTPSPTPEPVVAFKPEADGGPVLIQIEYRIDPARADDFVEAMRVGASSLPNKQLNNRPPCSNLLFEHNPHLPLRI